MKIYIINLESCAERREYMSEQMDRLKLDYEFFPAVNGRELSESERVNVYDSKWGMRYEGRKFTDGEIGCALSHINLYRKMIKDNVDSALVLEDDCWLTPSIVPFLKALEQDSPWDKFDLLLLSGAGVAGRALWSAGTYHVYKMTGGMMSHAYVISRRGAKAFAEKLFPVCHFADSWTWMIRHHVARFAATGLVLATQDQLQWGSSTINRTGVEIKPSLSQLKCKLKYKLFRAFWKITCYFYNR